MSNDNVKLFWQDHGMKIRVFVLLIIVCGMAGGWGWVLHSSVLANQLVDQLSIVAFAICSYKIAEIAICKLTFKKNEIPEKKK